MGAFRPREDTSDYEHAAISLSDHSPSQSKGSERLSWYQRHHCWFSRHNCRSSERTSHHQGNTSQKTGTHQTNRKRERKKVCVFEIERDREREKIGRGPWHCLLAFPVYHDKDHPHLSTPEMAILSHAHAGSGPIMALTATKSW